MSDSAEAHAYCPETGFCKVCGVHREMAQREYIDCLRVENLTDMSHRRAAQKSKEAQK